MLPRSCDTMVALGPATVNGQTLFAKNSDRPEHEAQPLILRDRAEHHAGAVTRCQFVEIPEARTTWRHVGSRPCWCWGYEHGFNEHQVVIGNEGLQSKIESANPRLIGMELLRLGLERGRTAAEAVEVMTDLITRYGQGIFEGMPPAGRYDNGYLVADPREAYVIETAGSHWAVKRVEKTVGISNVYSLRTDWDRLSPEAKRYAGEQEWWRSEQGRFDFGGAFMHDRYRSENAAKDRRLARSCAVLEKSAGSIDAEVMMALLSDHSHGETPDEPFQTAIPDSGISICVHYKEGQESGNTAASLVADLCADGSRLPVYWCSFYSPCLGVFLPLFLEGDLPSALSQGDASPSEESIWWQFHRLSHAARAEGEHGIRFVREGWAALQSRLFRSAYQIAQESRRLIENGDPRVAPGRLLTDYMNDNVAQMQAQLSEMLQELGKSHSASMVSGRV